VALIRKSCIQTDFAQGHGWLSQQILSPLKPPLQDVLMGADACGLLAELCEVKGAQARIPGQFIQVDIPGKIGLDVLEHSL
jgi:hypothetical protein